MASGHSASASSAVGNTGTTSANASSRASPAAGASAATASGSSTSASKSKISQVNSNGYHPPKPANPLSSLRSAPLDLSSVERRGQPTAGKEPTKKKNRPHDIEEGPTYYPTEEEWKEPFRYIKSIRPEAEKYGICKIVPPESWNPDFAIDTERFHFHTRKQALNSVQGSKTSHFSLSNTPTPAGPEAKDDDPANRANNAYVDGLSKYHKQHGMNLHRLPYVDKKPLDLYRLKKAVEARGGFDRVCKQKKWAEIGRDLGYSGKIMSSLSTSLKNSFQKYLIPYEEYLKRAKPGVVRHQLEVEYGGPLTPSPAPSPMKRSTVHTPSSIRGESPARNATDALQATMNGVHSKDSDPDTPMADASPAPAPATSGGFTAINTGGFTPVNAGFTSVNRPLAPTPDTMNTTPNKYSTPLPSSRNTPDYRPSSLGPTALKRQLSCESLDSTNKDCSTGQDDGDPGSRRSKRLKKDTVPNVAGSHMSVFRPTVPRTPRTPRDETAAPGENCEQCGKGPEDGNFMLICESCDHGYHGTCLEPPITARPETEWNCPRCLVGDGNYGFEEGGLYSLKQFQEKAARFKQDYFEKRMPKDDQGYRPVTEEDVEKEFWRLVADLEENCTVEYGADIHCTTHGSGFPTIEKNPDNQYSADPWNLNLLPLHPDSLFRHIKSDISGMTVPWVYVGMTFSTFCWHNEDHYCYSANYQHFGATKTWYGVPAEDSQKFEEAMKEAVPELFETQPDLLFQLVTLLPPEQLKKAGVRVYALDQRAGQFVITFPRAYHAGFNHGFNFNEAVNFAPSDWEPYGLEGVERLKAFRRQPCFSHDELLWTAAEGVTSGGLTIQTARWLAPALDKILKRELSQRKEIISKHNFQFENTLGKDKPEQHSHSCVLDGRPSGDCPIAFKMDDVDVPEEEYACCYCKAFTYLSRFICLKTGKVMCLEHASDDIFQCCERTHSDRMLGIDHALYIRKSEEAIASVYKKVADKAHIPEAWEEKYAKLLDDEPIPAVKSLKAILSEGEKIPFELPSLPTLRHFVGQCNDWLEEATNYTVRKQQNRRKSEKAWQMTTRKSVGNAGQEQKERETRNVSNIYRLVEKAKSIGFDCPEITQLQERAESIRVFQDNARRIINSPGEAQEVETLEEMLEEGQSFNVDIPELEALTRRLDQARWNAKAKANKRVVMTLEDVRELISEGERLEIQPYDDLMVHYREQLSNGITWEMKAKELIQAESVHYPQLQALSEQAAANYLPVSTETLHKVEQILLKQREAQRQISDLNERSKSDDYRQRPKYSEVAEIMKKVEELQAKPQGTLDLEKEQKRHEDWMRKGKKLFGKTNAPLHILKSHMDYVLDRNMDCFDIEKDRPRVPAEPASREPSPDGAARTHAPWDEPGWRDVFCICRRTEAGMMIECEMCHEWYHGKCLKIARGKVKDEDKYTCPICDWRVKIPRDAARPKLEDLVQWRDEIPNLPFQPEEAEVLNKIIDNAQGFRNHIASFCNPVLSQRSEAETQRFYLRKIEGAEVLLAYETNFFRQELHKWCPVAPEPPPVLESSKSTRKPRPTKLQKMLAQYGVDDPDDLPEEIKGKANSLKRKALNAAEAAAAANSGHNSMSGMSTSPRGTTYPFYSRNSSTQPQTPGLPIGHPSHGADPGSAHGHHRSGSNASMDPASHHHFFMKDANHLVSPHLLMGDHHPMSSFEDRVARGSVDRDELMSTDGKKNALDMFSRTDTGRREVENMYGADIWSKPNSNMGSRSIPTVNDPLGIGMGNEDDSMFVELVNEDDDEETERRKAAEHSHFENLEVGRHEMESSVEV